MPELSPKPRSLRITHRWQLVGVIVLSLWFAGAVWIISWQGRKDLRTQNLNDCIITRDTNKAVAQSWRAAAVADQAIAVTSGDVDSKVRELRIISAKRHRTTALVLEKAARINCDKENPEAKLIP